MPINAEQLAKKLYEVGMATDEEPLRGCSEADIVKIENRFRVKLPAAYVQFMRTMGRDTARFMNHCIVTYPTIFMSYTMVLDTLEEYEIEIPETAFAFLHDDGDFLYFDTKSGAADPPIYVVRVMDEEPERVADSFSEFLSEHAQMELDAFDRVKYEKDMADHYADPYIQKREAMIKSAPFQPGDKVQLTDDIEDVETNLGDNSVANYSKGQKGIVESVQWDNRAEDDPYGCWVVFSNEADTELIGYLHLSPDFLERAT